MDIIIFSLINLIIQDDFFSIFFVNLVYLNNSSKVLEDLIENTKHNIQYTIMLYIYKVLGDLIDGQDYWRRLRFISQYDISIIPDKNSVRQQPPGYL